MIGRLCGELVDRDGPVAIVDCGGVGYVVTLSSYSLASIPPLGETVTLRIYTQVMETRIALYGFLSTEERELFDLLITVKKVGPSSAMGILSGGAGPTDIAQMIASEQVAGLTKLPGVGKKTAEFLIVELHEKCQMLLATWGASGRDHPVITSARNALPPIVGDVVNALEQLGWRAPEVDRVVSELHIDDDSTLESLIRQALRSMPR